MPILPAEASASFIAGLFSVPAPPIRGNSGRRGFIVLTTTVSEIHWEESGGSYTLSWGGHVWTLEFDEREPGFAFQSGRRRCQSPVACTVWLRLGRFETQVFSPATLVNVERYRASVQATFAPKGWGGLIVRAAWSPSCGGRSVDLEVQASASSVGVLRDVEVIVQSLWGMNGGPDPSTANGTVRSCHVMRVRRLFSYDGRETADRFARPDDPSRWRRIASTGAFTPPGVARGTYYVEMVQPNDAARQIRMEPSLPETSLLESDDRTVRAFRARLRERGCLSRPAARHTG